MVNKHKQMKKKEFQELWKEQQGTQCSNQEQISEVCQNNKRRKAEKKLQHFQEMQISDNESKKSVSSLAESVESGDISASSSE